MSRRKHKRHTANKQGSPAEPPQTGAVAPVAVQAADPPAADPAAQVPAAPAMPKGGSSPQRLTPRQRLIAGAVASIALLAGLAYQAGWWPIGESASPGGVARIDPSAPTDKPKDKDPSASPKGENFLEAFGGGDGADGDGRPTLSNVDLEKNLKNLQDNKDQLRSLSERVSRGGLEQEDLKNILREGKRLQEAINREAAALEKDVRQARKARPDDPVPQWLTGELLIYIGGEPATILPYFEGAVKKGLANPRVFASLARTLVEANQFDRAYAMARKALDLDPHDSYVWKAYAQAAGNIEKFADILESQRKSLSGPLPDWAKKIGDVAKESQERLAREQKIRRAEASADNLPRVRLLIEHRRFKREAGGVFKGEIEATGRGEVVLELFENEAPLTVANFLSLVAQKKYDGTRFYLAQAATLVAGGDVESVAGDPKDDGRGNPGYCIPDEYEAAAARPHFRGSLSMVNTGPKTAGSQFFITLAPNHPMDGHFTVFGRVISGQDVVDAMTPGRTNTQVGVFGPIVPGDLLVRAEVIRKRPHDYKVVKLPMK